MNIDCRALRSRCARFHSRRATLRARRHLLFLSASHPPLRRRIVPRGARASERFFSPRRTAPSPCAFSPPNAPDAKEPCGTPRSAARVSARLRPRAIASPTLSCRDASTRTSRSCVFAPRPDLSRVREDSRRSGAPSTTRSRSPASPIARRVCRGGCAPSLRARTRRPGSTPIFPRACLLLLAGVFVFQACRSPDTISKQWQRQSRARFDAMKPLILLLLLAQTADPVTESRKLAGEAMEAYRAKNAALFLEKVRAAAALRPKHPTLQYQFAIAQAMNGANDDALALLEHIAEMGFVYNPQKQPELAALASSPRFAAIVERFASNAKPFGTPQNAFTLDEKGIIGEGLAFDAKRDRFFVSSVHARKIFAIDRNGHASTFAENLDRGAFGMAVDAKRNGLGVATSSLRQVDGFQEADRDTAALVKLDLRSGRVLATLRPDDKDKHLFGDVTLASDGEVFVSDSVSPAVFHVEGNKLAPFARGAFASLQGLAATNR